MGTTDSKADHDTTHLQGTQDKPTDEADGNHTPLSNRRLVKLRDPRSPTDEVQRTPIIVPKPGEVDDSFEDPRSPTTKIARTPIPETDPRSPTEGVSRTPCPFTYPDPRSPTVNVPRTPMVKESEPDKFQMPSVGKHESIAEEGGDDDVQNVSNNNSSDTALLIHRSHTSEEPEAASVASGTHKPSRENMPDTGHTDEGDCQKASLIASEKGPSKKTRRPSLTKSIKAKINGTLPAPPRSPLSTRNLDKDAPTVQVRMGDSAITYNKMGSRRRQASGTPTRLVGKYEPMIDKENF
ncbi:uncharacterized protein LOC119732132 [Patiria miniata]|uniref:Uncharacterized protein n=1 Tax=Patiria miniata TaxID=46514 RepID=A0A914AC79_PATMI|nr:uncharacterized protein LOC119732132 [Patiria miniata]